MKKLINFLVLFLFSIFFLSCERETLFVLSDNIEGTNEGFYTHNGEKFTGGAVNLSKRKRVRSIEYFDDGEYIGITRYNSIARLDSTIMVQGERYRINTTPNSILNQEGYTSYYRGEYIDSKVPGYWRDGDLVKHGIAQRFDSEGNVIEEVTFVHGEIKEDK